MTERKLLIGLLWFNAFCAITGGLGLIADAIPVPERVLVYSGFPSFYFPGVILFAVVGGSSLIAALAIHRKLVGAELMSLLSGVTVVFWILGEVASIREVHWLHLVFLLSGLGVVVLSQNYDKPPKKNS